MAPSLDEETVKKVIRQVEFYFSDSNLPRDQFLKKTITESDDGLVSLALICSFSRMRGHLGLGDVKPEDVPEDVKKAVAETLRTSSFLKVSEDGEKVGRVTELPKPDEAIKQSDERTIAASPLEYEVKLEEIESFFGQHAKVNSVRLPRHVADNRAFCGTALVEFSSEEDAAKVLKQTLTYSGVELELKTKKDFDVERAKEEEEAAKTRPQVGSNHKEKVDDEPSYPKGLIVAFALKKNPNSASDVAEEDKMEVNSEETKTEVSEDVKVEAKDAEKAGAETEAKGTGETEKSPDAQNEKKEQGTGEARVDIASLKDNKDVVLREDLKIVFGKFGTVKFIDFNIGAETGYLRFEDAEGAQKARAAAVLAEEGGLTVKNFVATLEPVTGDAEKEYWSALRNNQGKHRDSFKSNRGRGGRHNNRGGGGRHFGGKHSRSRDNDSNRSNKFQKVGAA